MEVLCINGKFSSQAINDIPNRPIENKIYTIRKIIPTIDGRTGVLLEEIINPHIEIKMNHSAEPRFNIDRFRKLDGSIITKEEIKQIKKITI